jgi:hypothetical protein
MLKCLSRYALLCVAHTVWSVSEQYSVTFAAVSAQSYLQLEKKHEFYLQIHALKEAYNY